MTTRKGYGSTATPTNVQVIAPATLNAGYTFDAMYDGVTFTVTVPDGGVVKGQRFIVPFSPPIAEPVVGVPSGRRQRGEDGGIPIGVWRDGLCNCCAHGPCHPHFLNSWFCRSILVGQLLTRMKMTWLGKRDSDLQTTRTSNDSRVSIREPWRDTFRNLVALTVVFFFLMAITSTPETIDPTMTLLNDDEQSENNQPSIITYDELSDLDKVKYTLNGWISTLFSFYIIYIVAKLRATMRQTYSIPEESCLCCYQMGMCGNNPREGIVCCGRSVGSIDGSSNVPIGWEDVCCSVWCQMCVAAQMARHTVDYEDKRGVCCNHVGVEDWGEDDAYAGIEGGVAEGSVLVV
eukprot:CCRYP_014326-RA/>CCRYP_014326-RA protein AED:0.45 eAED:0.45 QI:0/-1/0/1/-1/1/1/0/346